MDHHHHLHPHHYHDDQAGLETFYWFLNEPQCYGFALILVRPSEFNSEY